MANGSPSRYIFHRLTFGRCRYLQLDKDRLQRERIESINQLSTFVYTLKSQLQDHDGYATKLSVEDRQAIQNIVKEGAEWLEDNQTSASKEDLDEKLTGTALQFCQAELRLTSFLELQSVVNPITAKLYQSEKPSEWAHVTDEL